MAKIFVNEIITEDSGSKRGIIVWDETIAEAMHVLYDKNVQSGILNYVRNPEFKDGFHMFSRFYQLIVYLSFSKELGFSIILIDYNKNLDTAFEEYYILREKNWSLEDRNTILKIFSEIKDDSSGENAEMIIKFHIPA